MGLPRGKFDDPYPHPSKAMPACMGMGLTGFGRYGYRLMGRQG